MNIRNLAVDIIINYFLRPIFHRIIFCLQKFNFGYGHRAVENMQMHQPFLIKLQLTEVMYTDFLSSHFFGPYRFLASYICCIFFS